MTSWTNPGGRVGVLVVAMCLPGAGCGDDELPIPDDARRNVMVIDDGFDTSLPVFQHTVAAGYTVACQEQPGGGDDGSDITFDEGKAALLDELARPDESCHLVPGIAAKANPFADLERLRASWNQTFRADQLPDGDLEAFFARLDGVEFHGTATAGVVADYNGAARLVLVERPLATREEVTAAFTCFTQDDIDVAVALLSDGDVRQAYVQRPVSTLDRDLAGARLEHHVGLVNESFGRISRHGIERLLDDAGCPPVAFGPYMAALGTLERAYEDAHPEPAVLVVQAAGNDGALIDSLADDADCRAGSASHILIGSNDLDGTRSDFTNFGACVDAYAPGELVLAPLPGDWLLPLSGTSFAAPLVTRLLMFTSPAPFDPATALAALRELREPSGNIPRHLFRPEMLWDPRASVRRGALTAGAGVGPGAPGVARPDARLPAAAALRRVLAPIRWVQRRRASI